MKDYTVMTGPLGVTHLLLFSKSSNGNSNLRIALTPRGPTLNFRIENYSLCKDVIKALKRPRGLGKSHTTPPLLVMNNFMSSKEGASSEKIPKHLESLVTTVFQSLFPPISPQTTPLASIRRIMLLDRDQSSKKDTDESFIINLRHYAITTKRIDLSKRIRRLNPKEYRGKEKDKAVPNLGKLNDVADYLLSAGGDAGFTSASETEMDTDAEVEVLESTTRKVLNKKDLQRMKEGGSKSGRTSGSNVEKRAVKLVELGPRMKLKLMKVEEGLCGGRVMWHDYVTKTREEAQKLDASWEKKRKEKELRRKIQKENVERKKALKAKTPREGKDDEEDDSDEIDDEDNWDSEDFIHEEEEEEEAGEEDVEMEEEEA